MGLDKTRGNDSAAGVELLAVPGQVRFDGGDAATIDPQIIGRLIRAILDPHVADNRVHAVPLLWRNGRRGGCVHDGGSAANRRLVTQLYGDLLGAGDSATSSSVSRAVVPFLAALASAQSERRRGPILLLEDAGEDRR